MQNESNNTPTPDKKLNAKLLIIIVVCTIAITIAIFYFISQRNNPTTEPPEAQQVAQVEQTSSAPSSQPPAESAIEEDTIDFDELVQTNSDTIGYITVPGTVIDYPVVRGIDNLKYLTTDFYGNYDVLGTVFADMFNSDDLQDPVTVLYGHYEPNDTFFSQLHRYNDAEYFNDNPDIYLTTPTAEYRYEIVAAFVNDNYNLLYDKDYTDPVQLQGFIDKMVNIPDTGANLNLENVTTDDKFLALSTCMDLENVTERYVVVAKLVE